MNNEIDIVHERWLEQERQRKEREKVHRRMKDANLTKREPLKRATINGKVLLRYVRKAPTGTDVYQLTFDGHTVTSWIEGDAESGDTHFRHFRRIFRRR
jgi:hypothetical protein